MLIRIQRNWDRLDTGSGWGGRGEVGGCLGTVFKLVAHEYDYVHIASYIVWRVSM